MREDYVLHKAGKFWVTNEGPKGKPSYHVWITGVTHSNADSAYSDLSLAICRADYLNQTEK